MTIRIFLDDDRNPGRDVDATEWIVVRDVPALLDLVSRRAGEVLEISFDNDLRQDLEGRDGLNAIAEMVLDHPGLLGALERITVHSANGEASKAMLGLARNLREHGHLPDIAIVSAPCTVVPRPLAAEDDRRFAIHTAPTDRNAA